MPVPADFERSNFADDFFGEDPEQAQRLEALKRVNPRDRRTQVEQRMNEKQTCEICGSMWFEEITFNQYRAGTYSSTPGGAHEALSPMPMTILRCLCGHPVTPNVGGALHGGRTPNENLASFDGSLQVAVRSRVQGPQATVRKLVEEGLSAVLSAVPSLEDLQFVNARVGELERALGSVPQGDTKAAAEETTPVDETPVFGKHPKKK